MKTYLINLDKDVERLTAVDEQLKKFCIAYERVSAVYGKNLDSQQLSKYVSRFRTLMTHGMMWSPGQIGCTLSHLFLYRRMVRDGVKVATIFEDDVKFSNDFPKAYRKVEKFIDPTRRQVVLFSDHRDNIRQRLAETAEDVDIVPIGGDICSEAYAITLPAAQEILRVNFPMVVMVDAWTRYRTRRHIDLFRVEPPLARQNRDDFATTIKMSSPPYSTSIWKIAWKAWRLFGHAIDEMLFLTTGK